SPHVRAAVPALRAKHRGERARRPLYPVPQDLARSRAMIHSLRAKLLLGTILVIVLVMAAVVVVVEHTLRVAIIDELERRGRAVVRYVAAPSAGRLLVSNFPAREQAVVRAAAEQDVVYGMVLDADGRVAAHSRYPERVGLLLQGAVPERAASATEPVTQ